jgi:hypothetical protein
MLAMSLALRLSVAGVVTLLLFGACVPLPRRTATVVIAERVAANGTPTEVLQQAVTSKRTFYLIAPDGPVLEQWPFRFKYALVNTNGHRQELAFLTKKGVLTDWLLGFPISGGRWVAITLPERLVEDWRATELTRQVLVFQKETVLSSRTVTIQVGPQLRDHWLGVPSPGSPKWKPIRGGSEYTTKLFTFNPTNECLTFTTPTGNLVFDPNDGTLRRVNEAGAN